MDVIFNKILNFISDFGLFAAIGTIISTIFSLYRTHKRQHDMLKLSDESSFENAIKSDDIKVLGDYLINKIGKFKIHDYTSNEDIKSRVDKYLEKINQFISIDKDIEENIEEVEDVHENSNEIEGINKIESEYFFPQIGFTDLQEGNTWNALATFRREVEKLLKGIAIEKNIIQIDSKITLGKLIQLLKRAGLINDVMANNLNYSISICNKAIHGEDIPLNLAQEAIYHGNKALRDISRI